MTGTMRYCSLNAHQRYEQSRRDDLEAIGNILMYFLLRGELPWMKDEDKSQSKQIQIKKGINFDKLLKGFPICFSQFMKYVRALEFEKKPDYKYLRSLFDDTSASMGIDMAHDHCFEWVSRKNNILKEKLAREHAERELLDQQINNQNKQKTLQQRRYEQYQLQQAQLEHIKEEEARKKEEKKRRNEEEKEQEKKSKNNPEFIR